MAAPASSLPDTLVTLKVNFDGTIRRFKLPLRDLGAASLENKLRGFLAISEDTEALFERYSDSAASYVVLDKANVSVYKQLYRAAKAKQKLKLRVTLKEDLVDEEEAEEEKPGPKPATVEDEPEVEAEAARPAPPTVRQTVPTVIARSPAPAPVPERKPSSIDSAMPILANADYSLRRSLAAMECEQMLMERNLEMIGASVAALQRKPSVIIRSSCSSPTVDSVRCTPGRNFAVACNSCDRTVPEDTHYHCSTCDDGDFDLCQDCVDRGITCHGPDHWLIKRFVKNGELINSTTERIAPKPKAKPQPVPVPVPVPEPRYPERIVPILNEFLYSGIRTCNSCVQELPEREFLHCNTCEDFDLCKTCFAKNKHGHHPNHGFSAAVEGTSLEPEVSRRLAPGRHQTHNAICDGCEKTVIGVRHKCLDCPDWDYCSSCVVNASFIHPNHRFVPIYEPLEPANNIRIRAFSRPTHIGICCDGPLCSAGRGASSYIVGDRFKCAVCHDTDFCANCEASPANTHNRTHPLIKFKTPVRHCNVTTTGEHENGQRMPVLGDRNSMRPRPASTSSRASETTRQASVATNVLTVVDVKPSEPATPAKVEEKKEVKPEPVPEPAPKSIVDELFAVYKRDSIPDGSVMVPNHVFEQTWVLRNEGNVSWPAGCSVKFVGGDYMGHVDPNHPAGIHELVSASESTISYNTVAPGQEFPFTVLLRTPSRQGRIVSNWRLTTKDGEKFGPRLWCDVVVEHPKIASPVVQAVKVEKEQEIEADKVTLVEETKAEETKSEDTASVKTEESQLVFPKLEKSPVSSIHEPAHSEVAAVPHHDEEEYEECGEDDEWDEQSEDGFLTDEEYDILDASDEEYLEDQQDKLLRK